MESVTAKRLSKLRKIRRNVANELAGLNAGHVLQGENVEINHHVIIDRQITPEISNSTYITDNDLVLAQSHSGSKPHETTSMCDRPQVAFKRTSIFMSNDDDSSLCEEYHSTSEEGSLGLRDFLRK